MPVLKYIFMEYLSYKYILKGFKRGDIRYIQRNLINPRNGKLFAYDTIICVLQGEYENKAILDYAKAYLKRKAKLSKKLNPSTVR
jgi:hypothetical protein